MAELPRRASCAAVPWATNRPPRAPAPGPKIDHIIGAADRIFVMLDHDERIALAAQSVQRIQESDVVVRVQADGGFVQHVANPLKLEPSWAAKRMRCASPPESVGAARFSSR